MDLSHDWGGDLALSPTGDLLVVDGSERTRQRVLRRLLTNAGDYIWHMAYGAGLPSKVGDTVDVPGSVGLVRRQMLQEQGVASDPPPTVTVAAIRSGVSVTIRYRDADTGHPITIGFDVTR